jgi:hypothetical protein
MMAGRLAPALEVAGGQTQGVHKIRWDFDEFFMFHVFLIMALLIQF